MASNALPLVTTSQGIGIGLAVCGNLAISGGLTMQKQVHNRNVGDAKVPYMKLPMWWCGLFLVVLGETGNFLAYGYASATVVAPLGSVSVVSNAFLSHMYLKEPVQWREVVGLILALIGSVTVVLEAPHEEEELTMDAFSNLLHHWPFLTFVPFVVVSFVAIAVFVPKSFMERHVIGYLSLCALSGSITVICTKGVSTAVVLSLAGNNQFFNPIPWTLVAIACISIFWNIRYLNMAMSRFGSSTVVPVYYVLFTFFAIAAGMVLMSNDLQAGANYAVFIGGILITVCGVFMITQAAMRQKMNEEYGELEDETEMAETGGHLHSVPEGKAFAEPAVSLNGSNGGIARQSSALHSGGGGTTVEDAAAVLAAHHTTPPRAPRRSSGEFMTPIGTPLLGALTVDLARRWSLGQEGPVLSPPALPTVESPPFASPKRRPSSLTFSSPPLNGHSDDFSSSNNSNNNSNGDVESNNAGRPRSNSLPSTPPPSQNEHYPNGNGHVAPSDPSPSRFSTATTASPRPANANRSILQHASSKEDSMV